MISAKDKITFLKFPNKVDARSQSFSVVFQPQIFSAEFRTAYYVTYLPNLLQISKYPLMNSGKQKQNV